MIALASLCGVGPGGFCRPSQAVQPVDPADLSAAEQATENRRPAAIVGDHQGRLFCMSLVILAGCLDRLHALGLEPLVGDAGQADDVLREGHRPWWAA